MKKHLLLNRLSSLLYLLPTDKINLSSALLPNSYLAPSYSVNSPTANNKLLGKQWNIQLQKINALNQYMPVGHSLGMLHHHHQGNSSKQNLMHGFLAIHICKIKHTFLLLYLSTRDFGQKLIVVIYRTEAKDCAETGVLLTATSTGQSSLGVKLKVNLSYFLISHPYTHLSALNSSKGGS